jgi:hypothetical protein
MKPAASRTLGVRVPSSSTGGQDGRGWRPGALESEKVGTVTRSGVVTAVEDRLITVRWDSGSESVFVPSAGSLRVTGHEPLRRTPVIPDLLGWRVGAPAWSGPAVVSGPILTMDRRPSAVLRRVFAGGAVPCVPQLWAQFILALVEPTPNARGLATSGAFIRRPVVGLAAFPEGS